jgi:type II secretory pathway predicted ATPase ExeA
MSLAEMFAAGNPFSAERVTRAGNLAVDVEEIHKEPFECLWRLIGQVHRDNSALGVVVWGEAGAGKSHLLSRLERLAPERKVAVVIQPAALQVAPDRMAHTIMHSLIAALTRGQSAGKTTMPLYRAMERYLKRFSIENGRDPHRPWMPDELRRMFDEAMGRLAAVVPGMTGDDPLFRVLYRVFYAGLIHRTGGDDPTLPLALRWLAGDDLDPAEASALDLRPTTAVPDQSQVLRLIGLLSQLVGKSGRTMILVFDQLHTLPPPQFSALVRFLHELLDVAANLLVVIAEVKDEMVRMVENRLISTAGWDRLGQVKIDLHRINPDEGRRIVEARLDNFRGPFLDEPTIRRCCEVDPLYPLGSEWWAERTRNMDEQRPRRFLQLARERWDAVAPAQGQGDVSPPVTAEEKFDIEVESAIQHRTSELVGGPLLLPPNMIALVGMIQALLKQCESGAGSERIHLLDPGPPAVNPRYHGLIRLGEPSVGPCLVTGWVVVVTESATSATGVLRRLAEDPSPPDRVVLIIDSRSPMPLGGQPNAKGREYREQLRARGPDRYREYSMPVDEYARLEAIEFVARLGNFDLPPDLTTPKRDLVIASHRRKGRYGQSALLRLLLGYPSPANLTATEAIGARND